MGLLIFIWSIRNGGSTVGGDRGLTVGADVGGDVGVSGEEVGLGRMDAGLGGRLGIGVGVGVLLRLSIANGAVIEGIDVGVSELGGVGEAVGDDSTSQTERE